MHSVRQTLSIHVFVLVVLTMPPQRVYAQAGKPQTADPAGEEYFERTVRPILVERCLPCHGPEKHKANLRLDTREAVLTGGNAGPIVTPGKPNESFLLTAVRHTGDLKMPPKEKISDKEIAALEKWIALGLPWPAKTTLSAPSAIANAAATHWAFQPVVRPAVPAVVNPSSANSNAIDRFILARLQKEGLKPNPVAGRRVLIRRATFDLHGLPPTPEEVDAFINDASPDAYRKLIDRLLASPRYGERWARHWLDVARYANNKGYVFFEGKEYPWAWTYRDYTIAAFNADKPYDRFVMEQLAADLLCPEDVAAQAALGFLTVGGHFMNNTHDILDDRIDVVTRGLMGLTVTCARCHDHKFDPIPSRDYYSLYGVFRSSTEPNVPPLIGGPPDAGRYLLYDAELKIREKDLVAFVTAKHTGLVSGARRRAAEYLLAANAARHQPPADDFMLLADPGDLNPSMIVRWRLYLADARTRRDPLWLCWHAVAELPEADFAKNAAAALKDVRGNRKVRNAFATTPTSMKEVAAIYGKLLEETDRHWKIASALGATRLSDPDEDALRQVLYGPTAPADAPLQLDWGFLSLFPDRATQGQYEKLLRSLEEWLAKGPPRAMVLHDASRPYDPRVFERGNPGHLGEPVPRQSPRIVNPHRKPFGDGSGRLDLAREIVAKSNPLTARVFVNRVWMHHFGKGLVGTPGDFGLRGDAPTHPELLDYLAAEFATDWSIKRLHKLIMTSAAYMQSSLDRADGQAADPENRLLVEAEPPAARVRTAARCGPGGVGTTRSEAGRSAGPPVRRQPPPGGLRLRRPPRVPEPAHDFRRPQPRRQRARADEDDGVAAGAVPDERSVRRDCAKKLVAQPSIQKLADPIARLDLLYRLLFAASAGVRRAQAGPGLRRERFGPLDRPGAGLADDERVRVRGLEEAFLPFVNWCTGNERDAMGVYPG